MNDTVFAQAIAQAFPHLDPELKEEIYSRVTEHMTEFLREKVYTDDPQGSTDLLNNLKNATDKQKASEEYGKAIIEKFLSLSEIVQKNISDEYNDEMTRVMHQIYINVQQN